MGIHDHSKGLLVAVLLLWGHWGAWAGSAPKYTQGDEGYVSVRILSAETVDRRVQGRGVRKPFFELRALVENRLPVALDRFDAVLGYHQRGQEPYKSQDIRNEDVPAYGQRELGHVRLLPTQEPVRDVHAALTGYRLAVDPAHTFELAQVLLRLASSRGLVDLAVAAEFLPTVGPEAQRLREDLRPWVAGGAARLHQEFGEGVAPLYALLLLGRVGNEEDVPVLLGVLSSGGDYNPSLSWSLDMRQRHPDHPMSRLFVSGLELRGIVEAAVREMRPELSAPALVALAYTPGPLRRDASALLRTWKQEQLVEALRGPETAVSLKLLCASRAPEAVPLVVALGMEERTGVDVKACLLAMPEKEAVDELVRVLGQALGPLEGTVFDVLETRGRAARAVLRAEAEHLGLPVEVGLGALARAVHERRLALGQETLRQTLAQADDLAGAGRFEEALSLLEQALGQARGHEQRAQVIAGHARVARAAAMANSREVLDRAMERFLRVLTPLPGQEVEGDLDPELVELGRSLVSHWGVGEVERYLEGIEGRVREVSRPKLAEVYMAVADGEERAPWERKLLARRALGLDAGNAAALRLVERQEALEQRQSLVEFWAVVLGVLLGGLAVAALSRWARRRTAVNSLRRKAKAMDMLRTGTEPRVVMNWLVFDESVRRADANLLMAEVQDELRRERGA